MTSVSSLRRALTPTGTLVIVGGESDSKWSPGMGRQLRVVMLSPFVAQRLVSVLNKEHYSGLERLAELAAAGQVAPCVEQSYSLTQVPDAIRRLKAGNIRARSSSRSESAHKCEAVRPAPPGQQGNAGVGLSRPSKPGGVRGRGRGWSSSRALRVVGCSG